MYSATLDFYNRLTNEDIFDGETFNLNNETLNISNLKSTWVTFQDCTFNCEMLKFKSILEENLTLNFNNCTFNCNLTFSDCTFESLSFKNTNAIKSLEINNLELHDLVFSNDSNIERPELASEFIIRRSNIDFLLFEKLNHTQGRFLFLGNKFGEKDGTSSFQNSTITNVLFGNNLFFNFTYFTTVTFKSTREYSRPVGSAFELPGFYKTKFEKISFNESNFIDKFQFENCDFLNTTWFENCENLKNSKLKFVACKFEKYSLFDNSKFNKIEILHSKFSEKVSFENLETNHLKIHQVTFSEAAYFDDIKVNNIGNCDRKTIRTIKQQLQKTENRIDFNKFRAYELEAHYKELDWKWNFGFRDKFILWATKWSTNFGNSWRRALAFTLAGGLLLYTFFYLSEIYLYGVYKYYLGTYPSFWNGFFRFFLVTDFYNPLIEDRTYIQNTLSWLIFIIGKIFIAFGIYEMIQAFRKFKP